MLTQVQEEAGQQSYREAQWELMERLNEQEPHLHLGWIDNRFVFLMQDNGVNYE